ncbi:hypothetical protein LUW76_35760 [Actinomadura madurae]|uniref:hypothetical protein n=1 Tax=Actinomadura madurae TaxID=1993 RepID=UPI0020271889|nr:hypothetical protein [Actinomadura madurae]URM99255.1 hypothetical protein LUW76_35760 [Actinomadura madurae]
MAALRRLEDWRPGDAAGRRLFEQLAAADPKAIQAAAALRARPVPVKYCRHLAFHPDLSEFAVVQAQGREYYVEIYSLPDGESLERFALPTGRSRPIYDNLLHLGEAIVLTASFLRQRDNVHIIRHRRPGWAREVLATSSLGFRPGLAAVPGGFVAGGKGRFLRGGASGPLREAPVEGDAMLLAGDAVSGRLAALIGDYPDTAFTVLDADLRVLARMPVKSESDRFFIAWFRGPDTVLSHGMWNQLKAWKVDDGAVIRQGTAQLPKYELQFAPHVFPLGVTCVPGRDLVAVEFPSSPPRWYGGAELQRIKTPAPFDERFPLFMSPAGEYVFFEKDDTLQLANSRLAELVTRPMGLLRAADLATPALDDDRLDENGRAVMRLLRARLDYGS